MAALLIVGVVVVLVLLYTADRLRQARSRARLLHAMNDRLTVAAAQIDQEQERRQRAARASAELTSVMPAINRPPLTLPGVAGHEPDPAGGEPARAGQPAANDAGPPGAAPVTEAPVTEAPVAEAPVAEEPAGAEPAAEEPAAGEPVAEQPAAGEPVAEAGPPAALEPLTAEPAAEAGEGQAARPAENTLTLPGLELGEVPPPPRPAGEGTLIMSPVPVPGARDAAAAGGAPTGKRPAGRRPGSGYQQANPIQPGGS